jgi:AraC-like DNA-binding protein
MEYASPPELRPFITAGWTYTTSRNAKPIPGPGHRVLPETGVSLCFGCRRMPDGTVEDPELALMGAIRTIRFFQPAAGLHIEAVRIKPEMTRALLGADPTEHVDDVTDMRRITSRRHAALLNALCRTRSSAEALALLLGAIDERARTMRGERAVAIAGAALDAIRASRCATLPMRDIARAVGVSARHTRRAIVQATGSSPKYHQRVERLNRVVAAADRTRRPRWARVAVEYGYYDQPHLIREVRDLAGCVPAELHAERTAQQPHGDVRNFQDAAEARR